MQIGSTLIVRRHLRAGLASCAVLFGALLLVPQEVLAQKQSKSTGSSKTGSSKAGSSKSSVRSSSGSKSPSVRSSGSRSSSARSRSSSTSRSKSVGSRSGSVSRSKPSTRPSSRPSVSNPRSSRSGTAVRSPSTTRSGSARSGATRSGTTSRPSLKPHDIQRPGGESDSRRHAIDIRDTKSRTDKIGRREGDPEYTHRPRHRRYPHYYPYYHPYRYYGGYFGGYHGYYGGFYRSYYGYYPWDFPYFFYGPFGYMYTPHDPGYHGGGGGGAYGDGLGGLDLNVKPKDAVVYINGDAIGSVDRYDGYPSYLWLEPGTHTISFYLEGYQTVTRQYTILADVVISVKERLQPGTAVPPPEEVLIPEAEGAVVDEAPTPQEVAGRLVLTVNPPDAAVYLDGHFLGIAGELSQLSTGMLVEPGEHVLELVRPGYHTEEVPLVVPPGEHITLDLALRER